MKAISAIIVVVLLLLISISLISVVYVWSSALTGTVTSTTEETTSELTKQLSGCLKIDAISGNKIYLRNCGKGVITNNSLSVFIDDVKVGHSLEEIGEDQTGTVNISGLWKFSMDRHNLKITNGAAFVQALIELEPNKDGLVGYWSFDEGSGNKVYDKSGNGNDGNLLPSGSGPAWTAGKFGSALSFDGTDDYVLTPRLQESSPNAQTTAVWIKPEHPGGCVISELGQNTINVGYHYCQIEVESNGEVRGKIWNIGWISIGTINWNIWNHIVISFNGSVVNGYINGESSSMSQGTRSPPSSWHLAFAATDSTNLGNGVYFNGIIDEAHVWNKALSPDQTVVMKMV